MFFNSVKDMDNFIFGNYKIKVGKKYLRIYKETKSKIKRDTIFPIMNNEVAFKAIRAINKIYDTHFLLCTMPIFQFDFDEQGRLKKLIPYNTNDIHRIVGFIYRQDKIIFIKEEYK